MDIQPTFGRHIRDRRESLKASQGRNYTLRAVARTLECQPAYLSMVERGTVAPPSETLIKKLAAVLGLDADVLLALAGKIPSDLREIILKRPHLFADLIRQLREAPEAAVSLVLREVRDRYGQW